MSSLDRKYISRVLVPNVIKDSFDESATADVL